MSESRVVKKKKIAVLMGGWTCEQDVSLSSGDAVSKALRENGHDVVPITLTKDPKNLFSLKEQEVEVVFNALHGPIGEDGSIQGFLEILQIPYTHSGVAASALAMNKVVSRRLFESIGLPTPTWAIVSREDFKNKDPFPIPYVIKPINGGSSIGIHLVLKPEDRPNMENWSFGDEVLVERYIKGREIEVALMGNTPLGAIEICPKKGFYDYKTKYTEGMAKHIMPAPMPKKEYDRALDYARRAHHVLGCRGVSRSDFLYDDTEGRSDLYLLEINTQPGMTPVSLLQEIAAYRNISFNQLVEWIVNEARCDQ